MLKKTMLAVLALSFLAGTLAVVPDAVAKRRCPPGQEDINNVCVPKPPDG